MVDSLRLFHGEQMCRICSPWNKSNYLKEIVNVSVYMFTILAIPRTFTSRLFILICKTFLTFSRVIASFVSKRAPNVCCRRSRVSITFFNPLLRLARYLFPLTSNVLSIDEICFCPYFSQMDK